MPKLFHLARVPEPEVMDTGDEVEAYASAAAQKYLAKIDTTFVDHLARLLPPTLNSGFRLLDVGCGPGQIPIQTKRRWPQMDVTGIDAAPAMIAQAQKDAASVGIDVRFVILKLSHGDQGRLPFPDAQFDFVTCNSVMHHLAEPVAALDEFARVTKPEGGILVRDLRRPDSLTASLHVAWFGRHYSGEMLRLYQASVRAAYTTAEMKEMLSRSSLMGTRTRIFRHGFTHIGIERGALRETASAASV